MTILRRGTHQRCAPKPQYPEEPLSDQSAFVLLLMADNGEPPHCDDANVLSDPYYACCEAPSCECPLIEGSRAWKHQGVGPGRTFDGRVTGQAPIKERGLAALHREWARNVTRPLQLRGPQSAYAVITPDGLWHECIEPEPHDLIVAPSEDTNWASFIDSERVLTTLQVAWRFAVAEFLMRYQHCSVVGMDAPLSVLPTRKCRYETRLAEG